MKRTSGNPSGFALCVDPKINRVSEYLNTFKDVPGSL